MNVANQTISHICQAPKTGTIRKVHWALQSVVTSGTVAARLEQVGGDGEPNGTLLDASAQKSQTVTITGWNEWDFGSGNGASVTQGDLMAVMLKNDSGLTAYCSLGAIYGDMGNLDGGFPYIHDSEGSFQRHAPQVAVEYDDGSFAPLLGSMAVFDVGKESWTGIAEWRGLRFQLEHTAQVSGFWVWGYGSAGGAGTIELFDSDGAAFASPRAYALDFDHLRSTSASRLGLYLFSSPVTLSANTTYRAAIKPTSGTFNLEYQEQAGSDEVKWDACHGGGQDVYWTQSSVATPTGLGDWSDTTTKRPFMGLIIDGLDDGVVPATAPVPPSNRRAHYVTQVRRPRRSPVISSLPVPPTEVVPVRSRRRQVEKLRVVRRAVPTSADQTVINTTAVVASHRRVR